MNHKEASLYLFTIGYKLAIVGRGFEYYQSGSIRTEITEYLTKNLM